MRNDTEIVFVGKYDHADQKEFAGRLERRGHAVGGNASNADVVNGLRRSGGKTLVLMGAQAGKCIVDALVFVLSLPVKPKNIILPARHLRTFGSVQRTEDVVYDLARAMNRHGIMDEPRVEVRPTRVWNDAKRKVRARSK